MPRKEQSSILRGAARAEHQPLKGNADSLKPQWALTFEEILLARSLDRGLLKRERTRCALLASAASFLEKQSAEALTVDAIIAPLGVARGTFYIYFKDVLDILRVLILEFHDHVWSVPRFGLLFTRASEVTHATNLFLCRMYAANRGLFAARSMHFDQLLTELHERINSDWAHAVVKSRRLAQHPVLTSNPTFFLGLVRMLISMSDDSLRERFHRCDSIMCAAFGDADALAVGLTYIWCTVLFGRPASEDEVEAVARHSYFAEPRGESDRDAAGAE